MKKIKRTVLLSLLFFIAGGYVWKIKNTGKINYVGQQFRFYLKIANSDVLAEVDGDIITLDDIDFEIKILHKNVPGQNIEIRDAVSKKEIFRSVFERKMLYKFLKRDLSFDFNSSERLISCHNAWEKSKETMKDFTQIESLKLKDRLCEQSLIEQYCVERVYRTLEVPEQVLLEYYRQYKDKFIKPEKVNLRQILMLDETKAKEILSQTTVENFSDMAKLHSVSVEGKNGGKLRPFAKGDLPAVFDIAFSIPVQQVQGIFKSTYGYHIFIVDHRSESKRRTFEEVRNRIRDIIFRVQREKEFRAWVESATASLPIKIMQAI